MSGHTTRNAMREFDELEQLMSELPGTEGQPARTAYPVADVEFGLRPRGGNPDVETVTSAFRGSDGCFTAPDISHDDAAGLGLPLGMLVTRNGHRLGFGEQ